MYFESLPKLYYPYKDKNKKQVQKVVPDIFRRVHLDKYFENRLNLLDFYLNDGETPESVAYEYYGSVKYHWIVLLCNNIVDVKREWPLSQADVVRYAKDKYGENNISDVHHYVMKDHKDIIVDWDAVKVANGDYLAVTNIDYETELNDDKRQIYLLDKRFVSDIIQQYKKLVK